MSYADELRDKLEKLRFDEMEALIRIASGSEPRTSARDRLDAIREITTRLIGKPLEGLAFAQRADQQSDVHALLAGLTREDVLALIDSGNRQAALPGIGKPQLPTASIDIRSRAFAASASAPTNERAPAEDQAPQDPPSPPNKKVGGGGGP